MCVEEKTDSARGSYHWEETIPGMWKELKCEHGPVIGVEQGHAERFCNLNGVWGRPQLNTCFGTTAALFAELLEVLECCCPMEYLK